MQFVHICAVENTTARATAPCSLQRGGKGGSVALHQRSSHWDDDDVMMTHSFKKLFQL